MGLGLVMGVYWRVDQTRPFVPFLSAADVSTTYGFGISMAPSPVDPRWSETQGAYVVLDRTRLGPGLELDLRLADLKDFMSFPRLARPLELGFLKDSI